jgi:hypothetical protein
MHYIVNPSTFTVGYQMNYVTSIFIRQLDEQDNVTHEIELLEAFPRNMNIMDLNHASSNQTHRLNILFAYRYWINVDKEKSPVATSRIVQFPEIPTPSFEIPSPKPPAPFSNLGSAGAGLESEGMAYGAGGLSGA